MGASNQADSLLWRHPMKPRILILSFSPIASDARVLKQIAVFARDYRVTTLGYGPAPDSVERHIRLPDDRVYWRYDRGAVVTRRYRRAYRTNPAVAFTRSAVSPHEFDVILANDIDAVGIALELAPRYGVHADLHEYAPRQKEDDLRWRVFVAPFVRWMCRRFLPRASSVTTVGEGIAREYVRRFAVEAQVVTNSAPFASLSPTVVHDPIRLVHSGACLRGRGIEEILEGVLRTRAAVSLDLFLVPNDPHFLGEIRETVRDHAAITVHDPVPYSLLTETLNAFDVGVHLLPPANFNNAWALPNKVFDYLQARLGVIVGPSPEMAALVQKTENGIVAPGFRAQDLARVLDDLSPAQVEAWKQASDKSASSLSADSQVIVWKRAVDAIVAGRGG